MAERIRRRLGGTLMRSRSWISGFGMEGSSMTLDRKSRTFFPLAARALALCAWVASGATAQAAEGDGLWSVYETALKGAKYVDLTHTITPKIPVWAGFAPSTFSPARAGSDIEDFAKKGDIFTYEKHGFEATEYTLRTDQLGTQ